MAKSRQASASRFLNPFRPGAGHAPPWLAGRTKEQQEFQRLLRQSPVFENLIITGLRGVGKTVLLETLRPLARAANWLWVGADLSESASLREDYLAVRLCTDLAPLTSGFVVKAGHRQEPGFGGQDVRVEQRLDYQTLRRLYQESPGLALDRLKTVLQATWTVVSGAPSNPKGIVFAYDEAQNLSDQPQHEEFPVALLLDSFQSLQRQGLPVMLVLVGLPTLFPKLVASRTYAERMFRVRFLNRLSEEESTEAILKPVADARCPLRLTDDSVRTIVRMSGGYPYFIQFICREVYDVFTQRADRGETAAVPVAEIEQKLDADFFSGRWSRLTDRQRDLLWVIAHLDRSDDEFSVRDVVQGSAALSKPFSASHINQMLLNLAGQGLVFKNRYGRYSFAVPLLDRFIRRQTVAAES